MDYRQVGIEYADKIKGWYLTAAKWFLFANLMLYVVACIVASGVVGPVSYIEFLYNSTQWRKHG